MRFEKWQALGNDYAIVEEPELPFEPTPARVRRLCAAHTGVGTDGLLLLSQASEPELVARLRIFNPDGSEAELSGNGARQAILYLRRRGWTGDDDFAIATAAGPIRARITGRDTCTVAAGRAQLRSEDYPSGGENGSGTLTAAEREFRFQHVLIGNPQCAIEVPDGLEDLDLRRYGPPIESHELFPNRTNVSFWRRGGDSEIEARIFERGVGETLSSGTGAGGAAVAAVLGGVSSPVTVHLEGGDLEVEVSDELEVSLTGWAVPVYSGELSQELVEELRALEPSG
jgi:diaminopimelate epimerase